MSMSPKMVRLLSLSLLDFQTDFPFELCQHEDVGHVQPVCERQTRAVELDSKHASSRKPKTKTNYKKNHKNKNTQRNLCLEERQWLRLCWGQL